MITRVEKVHIDDLDEDVHTPALTKNHPDLSLKYSSCISIKMVATPLDLLERSGGSL